MPNLAEQITADFPSGVMMPNELRELCDFLDRAGYPISGDMELCPVRKGLQSWFGEASPAPQQLAGFACGAFGSLIAIWLYATSDAAAAPVVHLGSEGEHLTVISSNFREFLALFGIGYADLGSDDLESPPKNPESAERLRKWLSETYGIIPPTTGIEIIRKAQSSHPDFEQWVRADLAMYPYGKL